jgi:hypothetical protein
MQPAPAVGVDLEPLGEGRMRRVDAAGKPVTIMSLQLLDGQHPPIAGKHGVAYPADAVQSLNAVDYAARFPAASASSCTLPMQQSLRLAAAPYVAAGILEAKTAAALVDVCVPQYLELLAKLPQDEGTRSASRGRAAINSVLRSLDQAIMLAFAEGRTLRAHDGVIDRLCYYQAAAIAGIACAPPNELAQLLTVPNSPDAQHGQGQGETNSAAQPALPSSDKGARHGTHSGVAGGASMTAEGSAQPRMATPALMASPPGAQSGSQGAASGEAAQQCEAEAQQQHAPPSDARLERGRNRNHDQHQNQPDNHMVRERSREPAGVASAINAVPQHIPNAASAARPAADDKIIVTFVMAGGMPVPFRIRTRASFYKVQCFLT